MATIMEELESESAMGKGGMMYAIVDGNEARFCHMVV